MLFYRTVQRLRLGVLQAIKKDEDWTCDILADHIWYRPTGVVDYGDISSNFALILD
jgi:hypothetical protein